MPHATSAAADHAADPPAGAASPLAMQHRLFAALSRMFGEEVPMYDRALVVNEACNRAVADALSLRHRGFALGDDELRRGGAERHGAIRIGRPDELHWIARFFACFAMEPHGFYDLAAVGAKGQPAVATAFRSRRDPEHRVFTSLLRTDLLPPAARDRVETLLAGREVFSDRAKALVERAEAHGGLSWEDAETLIEEATTRIFKWTGRARDHALYRELCDAGLKIAADVACFERHHLNHLTPNTFCIDLYVAAMRHRLGETGADAFRRRAAAALARTLEAADGAWMRLHVGRRDAGDPASFEAPVDVAASELARIVDALHARLAVPALDLAALDHNGFKDSTEGPPARVPILLRQDAYRALTEPVTFVETDGHRVEGAHTARFGEIEQRFFACTPEGRALYDRCRAEGDARRAAARAADRPDADAGEAAYARAFAPLPATLAGLLEAGLVHARWTPTEAGRRAAGTIETTDLVELARRGLVRADGVRYEDFLPASAAGIFASNLDATGEGGDAATDDEDAYPAARLEAILGRPIVDVAAQYAALEAASILDTLSALGVLDRLPANERADLGARSGALDPAPAPHTSA